MSQDAPLHVNELPPLNRDPSFWGMTATQFLGAFNDNLFKQLVLLICVDYAARSASGDIYQPIALALFAVPFVLFSGLAGWLSDRTSKRGIIVLSKVAEIVVMLAGMAALFSGMLTPLFIVLALMSTQSAFFGPSKYGILPEMFNERDLPQANGVIQMTTFVAIIFGMALAGFMKEWFGNELWMGSAVCVGIAVVGTLTSLFVRRTPIAHPRLPFSISALAINRETWQMLRGDRPLFVVLLVASLFWFVGGVVQPAVNAFGKLQLGIGDGRTSVMAACMGIGIAVGCALAGKISRGQVSAGLVACGAWGIVVSLAAAAILGEVAAAELVRTDAYSGEPLLQMLLPATWFEFMARSVMTLLGVAAGLFVVPLQVFMQARPPKDQKGRTIGAMNLLNWIGIVFSALFYHVCMAVIARGVPAETMGLHVHWIFAALALTMLPIAIWYRPRETHEY